MEVRKKRKKKDRIEKRKKEREKERMEGKKKGRKKGQKNGCTNQRSNQINQRTFLKQSFKKMKLFSQSDVKRECQPGKPSAKQVCPTVKQSVSGTRARSKLRPGNNRNPPKIEVIY